MHQRFYDTIKSLIFEMTMYVCVCIPNWHFYLYYGLMKAIFFWASLAMLKTNASAGQPEMIW